MNIARIINSIVALTYIQVTMPEKMLEYVIYQKTISLELFLQRFWTRCHSSCWLLSGLFSSVITDQSDCFHGVYFCGSRRRSTRIWWGLLEAVSIVFHRIFSFYHFVGCQQSELLTNISPRGWDKEQEGLFGSNANIDWWTKIVCRNHPNFDSFENLAIASKSEGWVAPKRLQNMKNVMSLSKIIPERLSQIENFLQAVVYWQISKSHDWNGSALKCKTLYWQREPIHFHTINTATRSHFTTKHNHNINRCRFLTHTKISKNDKRNNHTKINSKTNPKKNK